MYLDPRRPYKPLDVGNGLIAASVSPSGRLLSLATFHPEHGVVVLSDHPPFDESKRYDQRVMREYRASLAHPSRSGFGLRIEAEGQWRVGLIEYAEPRGELRHGDVEISVTTFAPRGRRAVVQFWRFANHGRRAAHVAWRWDGSVRMRRAAYPQLTEGGPLPPDGEIDTPWAVGGITEGSGGLRVPWSESRGLVIAVAVGRDAEAEARLAIEAPYDLVVGAGDAIVRRALAYARICALRVAPDAVCIIADHQILPLSWNRDAYYVATLLRRHGALELASAHLRWLFRVAEREHGVWGRAHLANGRMKDRAFQLDQQCYPLLEAVECGEASTYRDEIAETLRALERRREGDLYPTAETPADDPLALPFHFSSHVLLWRTLEQLARVGIPAPDAERVRRATLRAFVDAARFAYATDARGAFRHYHDANDLPTALAPAWGFCDATDPRWRATIEFAWSEANQGGYYGGALGGLGSVHTPHPWPLGDLQELAIARALHDASREQRAAEKLARVATWDDSLPEAYDENTGEVRSRHWFAWPAAVRALLLEAQPGSWPTARYD